MNASPSSGPEGGEAGRVRCLYCGTNNFPSSATCWQCGRPLKALGPAAEPAGLHAGPATSAAYPGPAARPVPQGPVDSALAPKAGAALGLMFPYIGLPVGMVFLMLDDARKTRLGWITIGWSLAGTVLNILLFLGTVGPTLAVLKSLMPSGGHGGSLPGLPSPTGGGTDGLNIIVPYVRQLGRGFFP